MGAEAENYARRSNSGRNVARAYASFEEATKGSIEIGKWADLVVLGQDPFKAEPSSLVDTPIERTMAGGRWTYEN